MTLPPPEPVEGPPPAPVEAPTATRRLVGLLLVVPAFVLVIWSLLVPSVRVLLTSMQNVTFMRRSGEWIGLENYTQLDGLPKALGFCLLLGIGPILAALVVGPLIGLAARAARPMRWATRVIVGIMLVLFAPVEMAAMMAFGGPGASGVGTLLLISFAVSFATLTAICAILFLAVFQPSDSPGGNKTTVTTAIAVAVIGFLAALAWSLQAFEIPWIVTQGGPGRATETPMLLSYLTAFRNGDVGRGAAIDMIILFLLGVLGIVATLVLLASRLRVELPSPSRASLRQAQGAETSPAVPGIIGLIIAVIALLVAVILVRAWFTGMSLFPGLDPQSAALMINTWIPPLLASAPQIGFAALAGYGIGSLRPLGHWSEWLLLPFAPWLFVGVGPLLGVKFVALQDLGLFGEWITLIPPISISIIALYLFTLFFAGLRRRSDRLRATGSYDAQARQSSLLATLGVVVLAAGISVVTQAMSSRWNAIVAVKPELHSLPTMILANLQQLDAQTVEFGTPAIAVLVLAAGSVAVQIFGVDKIALRAGQAEQDDTLPQSDPSMTVPR